jgi:diazepam-binding inhibitor (GABA receptor modulating acyl-CoA-binding protein)
MSNSVEFIKASEAIKEHTLSLTQAELLQLYGYYKQAVIGDINIDKPSFFNFKECKKWEIWNNCKGINKQYAEEQYILFVNEILSRSN